MTPVPPLPHNCNHKSVHPSFLQLFLGKLFCMVRSLSSCGRFRREGCGGWGSAIFSTHLTTEPNQELPVSSPVTLSAVTLDPLETHPHQPPEQSSDALLRNRLPTGPLQTLPSAVPSLKATEQSLESLDVSLGVRKAATSAVSFSLLLSWQRHICLCGARRSTVACSYRPVVGSFLSPEADNHPEHGLCEEARV